MCRLSLAWVTSENSTMLLGSDILRLFFTGPYLVSSPLCSVSGVDCPSVDPRQLPLLLSNYQLLSWSPATNCPVVSCHQPPLLVSCHQLPLLVSCHQLPLLVSCHQLPTASALQPPTASLFLLPFSFFSFLSPSPFFSFLFPLLFFFSFFFFLFFFSSFFFPLSTF